MAVPAGGGGGGRAKPLTMEQKLQIISNQHAAKVRKLKQRLSGNELGRALLQADREYARKVAAVKRAFRKMPTKKAGSPTRGGDPRKAQAAEQAAKKEKPGGAPTRGGRPQPTPRKPLGSGDDRRQPTPQTGFPKPAPGGLNVQAILDTGMSWIGTPYVWGGNDPKKGLDCSGLIQQMFKAHGVSLPRVSYNQARAGVAVSAKDARPGDILAMDWDRSRPGIDHVGVYLGDGKMLVAPRRGSTVRVQSINLSRVATIRRVLPDSAFASLKQSSGRYVYQQGVKAVAQERATPRTAGPTAGGGDQASNPSGGIQAPITASGMVSGQTPLPGTGSGPGGKKVAGDYGFAASFFNSDPELKRLLAEAIAGDYSAEKFAVLFQNTNWYRKHSASAREWIMLNHNDPAAARRKVEVAAAQIHRLALESGADITGLEAHDMAVQFLSEGWSDQELTKRVGSHVEFKRNEPFRGQAGANFDTLKARALEFGLTLNDDQLARWVRDLATQTKTMQDFENAIKEQAKILYPALTRQIAAGLTPQDVAGLYVQSLADILEIDPNSIDWAKDPLVKRAMSFKSPESDEVGAMALWQFEQEAKKDPRWLKTTNAQNAMMNVAGDVLKDWGLVF